MFLFGEVRGFLMIIYNKKERKGGKKTKRTTKISKTDLNKRIIT